MLWKNLFPVLLIWLFFEGVIKKLLSNSVSVLLVKDVILLVIYISFFTPVIIKGRLDKPKSVFLFFFFFYHAFVLCNSLRPLLGNKMIFLLGMRSQIFYIPVLFISMEYFKSLKHVDKFIYRAVLIAIPLVIYALYQLWTGELGGEEEVFANTGGYEVRGRFYGAPGEIFYMPTSVFSGFGRFSRYLGLALTMAISCYLGLRLKGKDKILFNTAVILSFLGLFISGRRTPLIAVLMCYGIAFGARMVQRLKAIVSQGALSSFGNAATSFILCLGMLVVFVSTPRLYDTSIKPALSLMKTTIEREDKIRGRLTKQFDAIWYSVDKGGIVGTGTGTQSLGVKRFTSVEHNLFGEAGFAKIIWEQGVFGFTLWLLMIAGVFVDFVTVNSKLKTIKAKAISWSCAAFVVFIVVHIYKAFQVWDDSFQQIFLWTVMGAFLSLERLERNDVAADIRRNSLHHFST